MNRQDNLKEADERSFYVGMSQRDINRYSISRILRDQCRGKAITDGLEAEMSKECESHHISKAEGCMVPWDVLASHGRSRRRDLNVTTFAQGGATVGTEILPIIELLRNKMVCRRLGTRIIDGLRSNVGIPRQSSPVTASALPESQTLAKSTASFDQIPLAPHRVGAATEYTRQLVLQSSVSVEDFIREDLFTTLAVKWDRLQLEGDGAESEPIGIKNTIGIGSVIFGATATWAKVISFETALAQGNADAGNSAFVTTPLVRAAWKNIAKIGSTFPFFIWEDGSFNDDSGDGKVNQYRAAVTNQISGNQVCFGNFRDTIFGIWGSGPDLLVNPYSRDTDAVVRVTANSWIDCCVRHAPSFVWSDAGNQ